MERLDRITTSIARFLVGAVIVAVCLLVILYGRVQPATAPAATVISAATAWPTSACEIYGESSTKYDECLNDEVKDQARQETEFKAEMYEGGDGSECFPDPRGGGC